MNNFIGSKWLKEKVWSKFNEGLAVFVLIGMMYNNSWAESENIALGKRYTMAPEPNYDYCTDEEDITQLTDGKYAEESKSMFIKMETVGWKAVGDIEIIIDLEKTFPISDVIFSTEASYTSDVYFPFPIIVAVSDDGLNYYVVAEMTDEGEGEKKAFRKRFEAKDLKTRGRYVMIKPIPIGRYTFCDEIEVIKGKHDPDGVDFSGKKKIKYQQKTEVTTSPTGTLESYLKDTKLRLSSANIPNKEEYQIKISKLENKSRLIKTDETEALSREVLKLSASLTKFLFPDKKDYILWYKNPWEDISPLDIPSKDSDEIKELNLFLIKNEYESDVFMITNISDKDMTFKISVNDLNNERKIAENIKLREVVFVKTRSHRVVGDALPLLDNGQIEIPAGETKQVWLSLKSKGVESGDYHAEIKIKSMSENIDSRTITLNVNIYPINIPDVNEFPLFVCNWSYLDIMPMLKGLEKEAIEDLLTHYTNVFICSAETMPWPKVSPEGDILSIDFTQHDKMVSLHKGARTIAWFWNFDPDNGRGKIGGLDWMNEPWKKAMKGWITQWISHLKELGLEYNDFFFYPFDETLKGEFRQLAIFLKDIDPRVRIYTNPILESATNFKRIAPYIDIWCPSMEEILKREDLITIMKDTNKPMWSFIPSSDKDLSPYSFYRLMSWKAWREGFTGIGFWCYAQSNRWKGDNAWSELDTDDNYYTVIYNARNAPPGINKTEPIIRSKRWEAWREGIEDYVYLYLLDKGIKETDKKDLIISGEQMLRESVRKILENSNNPDVLIRIRKEILDMIIKLKDGMK